MSKYIGRLENIGIGKETTRGTEQAASFWPQKTNIDFDEKSEKVNDESNLGIIEDSGNGYLVKRWAEGSITGPASSESLGLLLLSLFGSVSSATAGGESIVYDHTFTVQQSNQHQSLTLSGDEPNGDYQFPLAMIKSLEITIEPGKIVEIKADFVSKKGSSASLSASYTAENRWLGQHLVFKTAVNLAGLDAAGAITIRKVVINIEKNIEHEDILGSTEPNDFFNTVFKVSGNIEATYDNETDFKNVSLTNGDKAMRIDLDNTDVTIGTAENPQLKFDFAKVNFNEWAKTRGNDEIVKQAVEFKAFYSLSDAKMLTAYLTNLTATY